VYVIFFVLKYINFLLYFNVLEKSKDKQEMETPIKYISTALPLLLLTLLCWLGCLLVFVAQKKKTIFTTYLLVRSFYNLPNYMYSLLYARNTSIIIYIWIRRFLYGSGFEASFILMLNWSFKFYSTI
jgi:hypothetical protein